MSDFTRRDFLKTTATLSAAATFASLGTNFAHAAGSDVIKVGLIGCGGRGTGAAGDSLKADPAIKIVALGDMFPDRLAACRDNLKKQDSARADVAEDHCFLGFDAYKKVLATDIDLAILATPPGFRPIHIRAAVEAGKHIFAEKPVASDPAGIRSVLESADLIDKKNTAFVCGTQRRHQAPYIECMKRIHDGAIGDVVSAQVYWNQGALWYHDRQPEWSDMECQIRNWLYFTWLSGDHICEQHVHNLDVMNWAFGSHPESAYGMGGRQVRTDPKYGNIFDHFAIEYVYPGDKRGASQCRQIDGTDSRVAEYIVGTKGRAVLNESRIEGPNEYEFEGKSRNPYEQEHVDLIASIRDGKPLNEAKRIAESTLTAIMGRMSAYTGKAVTWEQALNSKLSLMPEKFELTSVPIPPVPVPGKDPLI